MTSRQINNSFSQVNTLGNMQEDWHKKDQESKPLIQLPTIHRKLGSIVRHKTFSERRDVVPEPDLEKIIDTEIRLKLAFLQEFQKLKISGSSSRSNPNIFSEGAASRSSETKTLLLGIDDRIQQLEQAEKMIGRVRETIGNLQYSLQVGEAEKADLIRVMEENKISHQQSLTFLRTKVRETEVEVEKLLSLQAQQQEGKKERQNTSVEMQQKVSSTSPVSMLSGGGCVQFSNLFSISGQIKEFCNGEHGSRFVIERLRNGAQPERSLVRGELGLPRDLCDHLSNPHCQEVILTLAETDVVAKEELLREVKKDLGSFLSSDWGREFVEKIVNL